MPRQLAQQMRLDRAPSRDPIMSRNHRPIQGTARAESRCAGTRRSAFGMSARQEGVDVAEDFFWGVMVLVARIEESPKFGRKILPQFHHPLIKCDSGKYVVLRFRAHSKPNSFAAGAVAANGVPHAISRFGDQLRGPTGRAWDNPLCRLLNSLQRSSNGRYATIWSGAGRATSCGGSSIAEMDQSRLLFSP